MTNAGKGSRRRLADFAGGRYGRVLVPAAIFQIILIGPAFASGREVTEFGARFGALGVVAVVTVLAGFSVTCAVAYEFARVMRAYNYRDFVRHLIGPLWPLFDVLFITFLLIILAALASAIGEILARTVGAPYLLGVGLMIAVIAFLEFFGRRFIEGFQTAGSVIFSVGFTALAMFVIFQQWDAISGAFERRDVSLAPDSGVAAVFFAGVLYVGFNQIVLPGVLSSLDRQATRRQAVLSGLVSATLAIIPFGLTYLAVMGFYPDRDVVEAPVVWFAMFSVSGSPVLTFVYVVLFVYASIATGVGLLKAFGDRVTVTLVELGHRPLSPIRRTVLVLLMLSTALGLAQFGIIALVAQGFTVMAYGFLALFTVPLLTRGVYLIAAHRRHPGGGPDGGTRTGSTTQELSLEEK